MIYLDHAATTPPDPDVLDRMTVTAREAWGNPSSPHAAGRRARAAIDASRRMMADMIGVEPQEIVFVASGSEGNTLALRGVCDRWMEERGTPGHLILLAIEHHCSLKPLARLRKEGWRVTLLPVDPDGILRIADLAGALTDDTALVSVQWANSEIGVVQPVPDIARICRDASVPFHCDAVQGVGQIAFPRDLPDLLTIAAHKFYGPKGVGALIVRAGVRLAPQVLGGGQEGGLRAGTENTPGIVGMARALEIALARLESDAKRLTRLRDTFIANIETIPGASLNGHRGKRLPNNAHFRFAGRKGETVVIRLDQNGICASAGSACSAGSAEPSHVLEALGRTPAEADENVRFTLGRGTTEEDLKKTAAVLRGILATR